MSAARAATVPVLATVGALFLLYTNWPVVAAQRGIVPAATAAAIPALLALAVLHQVAIRGRRFVVDRTILLMLGFLLVLLASSVRAEGYDVAYDRILVYLSEGLLVVILARNAIRTFPELRAAVVALIAAAVLLAGLALFQNVTDSYQQEFMGLAPRTLDHLEGLPPSARAQVGLHDRARGPVDEPNRFAQILLIAASLATVFTMNARRRRVALLGWASVALLLGGVLVTYSRGALVTVVVLLALAAPMRLVRPGRLVLAMGLGGVVTLAAVPGLTDRIATMAGVAGLFTHEAGVEPDGATRGRTTEMLAALAAYMDHPVLGLGPGQYFAHHSVRYQALAEISIRELPVPRRAHNLYLELAADTGTIGLLVFMAIPLLLLVELGRLRRTLLPWHPPLARVAAGFSMALLAYLGTGVFLHLAFERYYWLLVALAAAAAAILREIVRDGLAVEDAAAFAYGTTGGWRPPRLGTRGASWPPDFRETAFDPSLRSGDSVPWGDGSEELHVWEDPYHEWDPEAGGDHPAEPEEDGVDWVRGSVWAEERPAAEHRPAPSEPRTPSRHHPSRESPC